MKKPEIATDEIELLGRDARKLWLLDEDCVFLNNGSFGATPIAVLKAQQDLRDQMERQPVRFLVDIIDNGMRNAVKPLAEFLKTSPENLAFVSNATEGINSVLRSIRWQTGDEILATNHNYGAITKTIEFVCDRYSTKLVQAHIPFPLESQQQILDAIEKSITPKTRLAVLDHVTAPSAIVFPVKELVQICHDRKVPVIIDGAHAPGMLDLDLEDIGADYYAGNCHKWLFTPKGCAFLYAAPHAQEDLHHTTISWGWPDGFTREFDWTGTKDPTAWLSTKAALDFYHLLPAPRRREYNNELAHWGASLLEYAWNTKPACPPEMRGSIASILLPGNLPGTPEQGKKVHDALINNHNVEVPVFDFENKLWLRISAQAYNYPEEYERLLTAVAKEI